MNPIVHFLVTFTGHNGTGAISIPGVKVGDCVLGVREHPVSSQLALPGSLWEPIITVDDQLQQTSATDFSSTTWDALLLRILG